VPLGKEKRFFIGVRKGISPAAEAFLNSRSFRVVSETLFCEVRIFVEFERKPSNRGLPILNGFSRLLLVLALFSSS